MIQELPGHEFANQYVVRPMQGEDFALMYRNGQALVASRDGQIELPRVHAFSRLSPQGGVRGTYAFRIDDDCYYLLDTNVSEDGEGVPEGFHFVSVRDLRLMGPQHSAYACAVGYQLALWYRDNRFCGRCGHKTLPAPRSREIVCPNCGKIVYPKIQPAVICGVIDGDRLLVTRYAHRKVKHLSLVAGFNEVGETLEETCHREVMEEVGVRIRDLRYYKDQPWPFSSSILSGFYCRLDGDPSIRVDRSELQMGTWLTRDQIPDMAGDVVSLTGEMIQRFKDHPEAF